MIFGRRHSFGSFGDYVSDFDKGNYPQGTPDGDWCNANFPYDHSVPYTDPKNKFHLICRSKGHTLPVVGYVPYAFAPHTTAGQNERGLPGSIVGTASTTTTSAAFWQSIDPTTPDGQNSLADAVYLNPITPWPVDKMAGAAVKTKYFYCVDRVRKRKLSATAQAQALTTECGLPYMATAYVDSIESPEFRAVIDFLTGDVPAGVFETVRYAGEKITKWLMIPTTATTLGLHPDDARHAAAVIGVATGSKDFIMLLFREGPGAIQKVYFYQMLGGMISAMNPQDQLIQDIGWMVGDNAEILASIAVGGLLDQHTQDLLARKYWLPLRNGIESKDEMARRAHVLDAAGRLIILLGTLSKNVGDEIKAIEDRFSAIFSSAGVHSISSAWYSVSKSEQAIGNDIVKMAASLVPGAAKTPAGPQPQKTGGAGVGIAALLALALLGGK